MKVLVVVEVTAPTVAHLDPDPEGFTRGYVAGVLRGAGLDVEAVVAGASPPPPRVSEESSAGRDFPGAGALEEPEGVQPPPPDVEEPAPLEEDLRPYFLGLPGTGVTIPWGLDPDRPRRVVVHPVENPPQESPQEAQEDAPDPEPPPVPPHRRTARSRGPGGQRRRRGSVSKAAEEREEAILAGEDPDEDDDLEDVHVAIEGRDGGKAQRDRPAQSKRPLDAPPMRSPRDEGLRPPDLDEVRGRAGQGVSGVWDR